MTILQKLARFCVRLAVLLIIAGLLVMIPEPNYDTVLRFKNSCVAFMTVISIGVLLVDTFFFDRYR